MNSVDETKAKQYTLYIKSLPFMNTKSIKKIMALFFDTHNITHKKHSHLNTYLDTIKCAMVYAFKLQCGD